MLASGMLASAMPSAAALFTPRSTAAAFPAVRTGGLAVECSSRPKKKGTAHHAKTRPRKTQPWDIKRKGPTYYPPLPALPPDWTLVSAAEQDASAAGEEEKAAVESSA